MWRSVRITCVSVQVADKVQRGAICPLLCCRCRPLWAEEQRGGEKTVLRVDEAEAGVKMKSPGHGGMEKYFYDGTFGPEASQMEVYTRAAKPIVDNVLRGMNTCLFAYGQTGTGMGVSNHIA